MFALLMGLKTVSPDNLKRLIDDQAVTVIDVNSRESFTTAHVPGAKNLDPEAYGPRDLPQDRDAKVVFYCSNVMCRKAPKAARRAREMGYRNVKVMSAGIRGWVATNLPTESDA